MKQKWLLTLLTLIFTVVLAGCGGSGTQQAKVLKVGADAAFAPFEFQDPNSKEYVGFDIDLMKAIAKKMGYQVEFQNMGFDGLIPALQSGNIDVIASGMTINEERQKKVIFSDPYYKSGLSILVRKDSTGINSFADLKGKKIAVQIGSTGAKEAHKIEGAIVREFNTPPDAFVELKAGGVDAVINDLPVNQDYLKQAAGSEAKLVGDLLQAEDYGIAVNLKNKELADKINKALQELKQSGEYDQIYEKWFKEKPKA